MTTIENGHTVSVHYKGSLKDGDVFDTSHGREPLKIQVGAGQLIKGFENALIGMTEGEKKTVTIKPEQGYGLRRDDAEKSFSRDQIPAEMQQVEVGQMVGLQGPQGQQMQAFISKVDEQQITVDLNHPLAGKTLVFDIEVVDVA